jgi:hypothetical protein
MVYIPYNQTYGRKWYLSPNYKTNHTSDLVGVVEISGSTIKVYSTVTKHIAESGTDLRPSIQLCTSKWSNHKGFHPLPIQVSVIKNTSTLGCERHISHKTNHTSALVDVVENSGSTIRVYSTVTKHSAVSGTGHRPSIHSAHRGGQSM